MLVGTTPVEENINGSDGALFAVSAKQGDITIELDEDGKGYEEAEDSPLLAGTTRVLLVNSTAKYCPIRLTSSVDGAECIINPIK